MNTVVKLLSLFVAIVVVGSVCLLNGVFAVQPFGADITFNVTTRAPADDPESHEANAGNVTYMTLYGYTITQSWQGYYGNISGTVMLADNNDNVLYNWSLADPEGEVYASENGTGIDWGNIACFDLDADHNTLETWFNISYDDVDGVNETFSDGNTHERFYTANTEFTPGQCAAAWLFNDTGFQGANTWEEVLLTDQSDTVQVIFTSLIEEHGATGFDGNNYDFQMIVLEDGHGTDVDYRDYYFYVELQ
jgi:hypothetical protein